MPKHYNSSKYTPERIDAIRQHLEAGMARTHVAPLVGIGVSTFYEWLEEEEEFKAIVEKAESKAILEAVENIRKAGKNGDWRASAWFLGRRGGAEFIEVSKVDHTTNGKDVNFTLDFGRKLVEEDDAA